VSGVGDVVVASKAKAGMPVFKAGDDLQGPTAFAGALRGRGGLGIPVSRSSTWLTFRGNALDGARKDRRRANSARRGDGIRIPAAGRSTLRGYTLIEVIVAFAILALALTLLLGTLSGAARQVRWADEAGRAALHAQSLLDQVGVGEVLQPGHSDGDFEDGRYRWTLDVAPYQDPLLPPTIARDLSAPQLLRLSLAVQWGDGDDPRRRLQLQSLRLVTPAAVAAEPPL
jgi:general secretion pathway protein I